jgi:hypothetical protein
MIRTRIEIGQVYCGLETAGRIWLVERVFSDHCGQPHARLCDLADQTQKRTLSCHVLLDRERFARGDA